MAAAEKVGNSHDIDTAEIRSVTALRHLPSFILLLTVLACVAGALWSL